MASLLLAALALTGGGCATMINGRYQQIAVASTPAGATVFVDGNETARTPCVVSVTRHDNHTIRVVSDDHEARGVTLHRELTPWAWLNIANGGLPGVTVDATTGALYDLVPRAVNLLLDATGDEVRPATAAATP